MINHYLLSFILEYKNIFYCIYNVNYTNGSNASSNNLLVVKSSVQIIFDFYELDLSSIPKDVDCFSFYMLLMYF